jgi:glutamyl-tRNA reductase
VSIILVGLNHQTAPVALREQFALTDCALDMALTELKVRKEMASLPDQPAGIKAIHECVIVSTCNRLEVYAVAQGPATAAVAVEDFLAGLQGVPAADLHPHLYRLEERAAIEHLMRVASGLDSMILGEPQILGQVAQAIAKAQGAAAAGLVLSQLFARAVHAGRRARSETAISRHTTSVSHAAAQLAKDRLGSLDHARVLIVGAGEMAALAATALRDEGARTITCINRTYANAERLASQFGGRAMNWRHLTEALTEADVIVSATGAPHTVIYRDDVAQALPLRGGKPLVIVDIAVPRDVDVEVDGLPDVHRYDIDHLQSTVDANRAHREAAIPEVEAIIDQEADDFHVWLRSREVVPVLVELRRKAEAVAQSELEQALKHLDTPDARTEHAMALMAHRIIGKLLHEPTVRLKSEAANGNGVVYADALQELFALGQDAYRPSASKTSHTVAHYA